MTSLLRAIPVALTLAACPALAQQPIVNAGTPAPECTVAIKYDRDADLPGYLAVKDGKPTCLPFLPTNRLVPAGYAGRDYYGEAFTDAKIRAAWAECKKEPACAERVMAGARPFIQAEFRDTGTANPQGRIDAEGTVDLKQIRRPAFFAQAPYAEPIAAAEARTHTVEFTVPRDSYERRHLGKQDPIRLRGWYLEGTGVRDRQGTAVRALVIMNNGGGSEITAIDDPQAVTVVFDPASNKHVTRKVATSEEPGMRHWRGFIQALNAAGFDVLVTDRRGNGVSGGVSGFNTAEQANDMFRELEQMETGEGLRLLTPSGEVLSGAQAAGKLLAGRKAREIPVVIGGYSRGSYATAWAMHKNFVADCDLDTTGACSAPRGWPNIKGAILYGPNSAGVGYRVAGHDLIEAALRVEHNTTYYPDSDVLAGIAKWPGLLVVRGTWDYVEGMEGSFDAWRRAQGPKDIFLFHGPHVLATQSPDNMRLVGARMAAFARAAVLGEKEVEGAAKPGNLKELVLATPDHWELTTAASR
jgi:pimeloyl-ACP methyl ester carboxylesterase